MSIIDIKYNQKKNTPSDINEHIETLYNYAKKCDTIAEFGVFEVTSSYAFAAARPKKLICVDIKSNDYIKTFIKECQEENINLIFVESSTLDFVLEEVDLLFIDTLHAYSQLIQELFLHHDKVKKYIIFHDTISFGYNDEINYTGLLDDSIHNKKNKRGLIPAIHDFIKQNPHWIIAESFTNNNGLTVLKNTLLK
jgi:ribosomal protein L7Ae-like RNA K-turn-binding protein